ncbi:hypothetical protein A2T98_00690 [Nodularia spumigena CENA596]|uniref:FHA domain-containing protein n=4 Tax=Nodularia spumigena TaxID=70799 RepID=A0A166KZQ8_NODSP|nr:hypothetical protein A2T98_00690 [Nodularia spumigena CENA596]
MQIKLISENQVTEEQEEQVFTLPVAIGRDITQLPAVVNGETVSPVVLLDSSKQISRLHAQISLENNQLYLEDKSANGTELNGQKVLKERRILNSGDRLRIGNYTITVLLIQAGDPDATVVFESTSTIFNPQSEVISASSVQSSASPQSSITFNTYTGILEQQTAASSEPSGFPYSLNFWHEQRVSLGAIKSSGYLVKETEYVACGGGMGSFVWVDMLRIAGVKRDDIKVLSIQDKPYKRYETLLRNCQIPRYKRIRSGSDSCPDNIWGWPGYALRDAWRGVFSGQVSAALGFLWQVFAEPIHADTYTPRAKDVFESMDREGDRISWNKMLEHGSIRSLRQTEDGRYCIAYCASPQDEKNPQFLIAKYVHLCTGYPGIKLLPDLEKYRQEHPEETGDQKTVVQGYEPHDYIYQQLEKKGGTIVLRGSGIVASQVLDRLYAAQKIKPSIKVIHLNREPRKGNQFDLAKRHVENDWEFQPFNWPKGTWGGDMRTMLEEANPLRRRELLQGWGGTTTASRKEWRDIIQQGKKQQWYEIRYGLVTKLERNPQGGVVTHLVTNRGQQTVPADFVIDCTGLVSDPLESPFLKDLIEHYDLDLNPEGRFHVENDFEIKKVRNDRSRVYAAGIITLGGPYAPVDTFLGLQYAAHRSVEALAAAKAPGIRYIQGFYSLWQWLKWALNIKP